ncbi:MAG: alcohol dehydrogenase catalytic domain-containing protein [Candidatus Bathyarchaeia archaeon]|nr:alcohol dehydrogenase catalytic domain-containing protein [Candidatus Bathyarchaeota archaeon]
MKAVMKVEPKPGIKVMDIAKPKVGPRDVLVKVRAAAICGSDIHLYKWDAQALKWNATLPKVVGHEFCGDVVDVGSNVSLVKVGDKVAGETHIPCETCYMCRTGRMHICENMKIFGVHVPEGAFTEYTVIPETIAYKLPQDTSYDEGALYEPCGVAMHAVQRAQPEPGDTAVVLGCGPIGIYVQQIMKALGSDVIATDVKQFRIEHARKVGAAREVIDATEENVVERIKSLIGRRGADIVFEAAGSGETVTQSLDIVAKNGKVVLFGASPENPILDTTTYIVYKEIDVRGLTGRYMYSTWDRVQRLVTRRLIDLKTVITNKLPLEKAEEGFQLLLEGKASKIILNP